MKPENERLIRIEKEMEAGEFLVHPTFKQIRFGALEIENSMPNIRCVTMQEEF